MAGIPSLATNSRLRRLQKDLDERPNGLTLSEIGKWNYRTRRRYLDELVKRKTAVAYGHQNGNARRAVYGSIKSPVLPGLRWWGRRMRKLGRFERSLAFYLMFKQFEAKGVAIMIPRQVETKEEPGKYTVTWKLR